jgi:2-polyprenyl-3-methyl-5-hydroxy-6-metoxy-1,4-benzoquinol methylase
VTTGSGYYDNERPEVAALVPFGSGVVLDVGCGAGRLGARLKLDGRAQTVHGIERAADAVAAARLVLDDVTDVDLESDEGLATLKPRSGTYDVVIVADVLEHLRDPWRALDALVETLTPSGVVVASIPNVRVVSVVAPLLLRGRFRYSDRGVLDRTHLRFFTRESATALLEGAGLTIEVVERSSAPWRRGWKRVVGERLGDLGSEQFLFRARRRA